MTKSRDHLWKPGQSGNPKGRPKSKHALSEAIRERVDPNELIDRAMVILRDPTTPSAVFVQVWTMLAAQGWAKPPAAASLEVTVTPTLPPGWQSLPVSERGAYLESLRVRTALPAVIDVDESTGAFPAPATDDPET